MAKNNVPVSSKSEDVEVEIKLPGDKAKQEKPDTRLSEITISTKHLPEAIGWKPGEKYNISLEVLFRGLRKNWDEKKEQDAEMLILPRKDSKKTT